MKKIRKTIAEDEEFLRQISKPVDFTQNNWQEAIKILDDFCEQDNNYMAMASVQLGIPLRIIYLKKTDLERLDEDYNEKEVLINPVILNSYGLTRYWEACVSCLDNTGLVDRPYQIDLEYYDINGNIHHDTFTGFKATVISHEIDHLDGILHIDIASKILQMNQEERKKYRELHPYEIIRTDGAYIHPKNK
ncbi:MAG: peptide deformylase [Bacilli bacterium]|nr:peptide deformylase [Bacilli bacterium]